MTEATLQKQCNEYLRKRGILYFHPEKGRSNMQTTHRAGWPDMMIFRDSKALFVELKSETGKLRPEQVQKMGELVREGFECKVCRKFQEFKNILEDIHTKYEA